MGYSTRSISVDKDTWENARELIKEETGMTMSKFIEIYLRGITRGIKGKGSVRDIIADSVDSFIDADNSLTAREKLQMGNLFDQKVRKKKKK